MKKLTKLEVESILLDFKRIERHIEVIEANSYADSSSEDFFYELESQIDKHLKRLKRSIFKTKSCDIVQIY